jgi:putative N6-adenine-specific DNA methylase
MPKFKALTSIGIVDPLFDELSELGLAPKKKGVNWVDFETNWDGCLRANQYSRVATRILMPILDFEAFTEDQLYHQTLRHDFTQYIENHQTLAITASVANSNLQDQRMVALKVKDAIVDQFRQKTGQRPSVDKDHPHLRVFVRVVRNQVSLAVDVSGRSLAQRGYRPESGMAPMRENLAAGLLRLAEWQPNQCLLDFMCGSGTFLIEAALSAQGEPANRGPFAFQRFKKFRQHTFHSPSIAKSNLPPLKLFGSDIDSRVIETAKRNAHRAQTERQIQFSVKDFRKVLPPAPTGVVMVNPPYGERMTDPQLESLYVQLAAHLKSHFKGWTLWLLSGNPELSKALRLRADRKFLVRNGDIECRFLKYPIS